PVSSQRFPEDRRGESAAAHGGRGGGFAVQVLPPTGEKLPANVAVEMENLSGGNARIQWLQGDGSTRFDDVAGGSYIFRTRCDGYQDVEQTVFVPPMSRGRSTLILTLGPPRSGSGPKPDTVAESVVPLDTLAVPDRAVKEFRRALAESER